SSLLAAAARSSLLIVAAKSSLLAVLAAPPSCCCSLHLMCKKELAAAAPCEEVSCSLELAACVPKVRCAPLIMPGRRPQPRHCLQLCRARSSCSLLNAATHMESTPPKRLPCCTAVARSTHVVHALLVAC
ncbi:hypothetical protein Dimus_000721, partial [Dionaea muscipula]